MTYETPLTIAEVMKDISADKYVLPSIQNQYPKVWWRCRNHHKGWKALLFSWITNQHPKKEWVNYLSFPKRPLAPPKLLSLSEWNYKIHWLVPAHEKNYNMLWLCSHAWKNAQNCPCLIPQSGKIANHILDINLIGSLHFMPEMTSISFTRPLTMDLFPCIHKRKNTAMTYFLNLKFGKIHIRH